MSRARTSLLALCLLLARCADAVRASPDASVDAPPDAPLCATGADCDDGVACTADLCERGACANVPLDARCGGRARCDRAMGCVDPGCAAGLTRCVAPSGGFTCVNVSVDPSNCGRCGLACSAGDQCRSGRCVVAVDGFAARCGDDTHCASGLGCDRDLVAGQCSRACGAGDPTADRACGEGATCLSLADGVGRCARACDPTARSVSDGACPAGFVCTGRWVDSASGLPDAPGCVRFCDSDRECEPHPDGRRCSNRLGRCGSSGDDPSLRPDGWPCDPRRVATRPGEALPRSVECRGWCSAIDARDPSRGVCASYIDRARRDGCPDDPAVMTPLGPALADNLGLCRLRRCARDCECPTGALCLLTEDLSGQPVPSLPRYCLPPSGAQPTGVPCD